MRAPGLMRLLLWEYERGSRPYEVLCLMILLFILFVPAAWLSDPLVIQP